MSAAAASAGGGMSSTTTTTATPTTTKWIVMTGATRGLGAPALKMLVAQPGTRALIGKRGTGATPLPEGTEALPLDLASLASVRAFVTAVQQKIGPAGIDMLVLNAGENYSGSGMKLSADGFEATFAVNHLSHYLMARLLLPNMATGGRLVIVTSDTHDPAILPSFGPRTLDIQERAHPSDPSTAGGMKAYAASKLCNLLTARSFIVQDEVKKRDIKVVAYNPGLTLGTGLGSSNREQPRMPNNFFTRGIVHTLSLFNHAFYPGSPERAGEVLAQVALGKIVPPPPKMYVSLVRDEVTFPEPSELARNDELRDKLWAESAKMVGL